MKTCKGIRKPISSIFIKNAHNIFWVILIVSLQAEIHWLLHWFSLQVSVSDNGDPTLKSTSRVVIRVTDINDNPPSFSQKLFMVHLPEKAASETPLPVYRVIAADRDEGLNSQVTYSLEENSDDFFSIHPVTGVVFSEKSFSAQEYNILTVSEM